MTVKVFGSKLNKEPHETYEVGGLTVEQWLIDNVPSYSPRGLPPVSVNLNGALVAPADWASTRFERDDCVKITLEPKGTELFFGALFLVAIKTMTPKVPKVTSQAGQGGEAINQASIKGNKVKLNTPIREVAGTRKVYPDYLTPPRRWFAGPREQRVQLLLCIGKGEHDVPFNKILIGDTPAISLGSDVVVRVYGPGEDLSADTAAMWWNDITEVGSSSNGAAGLELTVSNPITPGFNPGSLQFNGFTIAVPSGQGSFPGDWSAGLIVRVIANYQYDFIDGGADRDIIRGAALGMLPLAPGDLVEIAGVNGGSYVVHSYTPASGGSPPEMTLSFDNGTPVTAFNLGTFATCIGPRGLRFRITVFSTSQITVQRLSGAGAVDAGFPGFDFLQSSTSSVTLDASSQQGGYRGPFAACPDGEVTSVIEIDVMCPSGLCGLGREGQVYAAQTFYTVEYRDLATAGAWTVTDFAHMAATLDSVGFTVRLNLPYPMRPEVRVKKRFIQQSERETEINNDTVWYGGRSLLAGPTSYAGVTVMTVDARGGDRLSAQSESQVSAEVTRKLALRSGGVWLPPAPTRDIAPFAAYLLKSVGYTDEDIDLAELDRLDAIWKARGDKYDQATNTTSTVATVLSDALVAGFSEVSAERGRLRPVRDEVKTQVKAMYSPQNFTEPLERQFTAVKPGDYDGVDVEYIDGVSWQVATVKCRLQLPDGSYEPGIRVQKITLEGVTNRTRAWRIGMRQRRALKYRRWSYSWSTELDALNSRYLDYVLVADDVPGYAQSAEMVDYDPLTQIVNASEAFDWSDAPPHFLHVRRADGSASGPYEVTRVGDFGLKLRDPLDFNPVTDLTIEPPHLLFGIGYDVLITDISPNGSDAASVEAMAYDARVYADDDNQPPADA